MDAKLGGRSVIRHEGTRPQRERAVAALLTRDWDPGLAALAQWMERQPYERAELLELQQ